MDLNKAARFFSYILKVIEGKDLYFPVEIKIKKEKFGSNYGGYFICPNILSHKSVVYSIGVGEDISFDLALIQKFHCKVYAFDPTPKSIKWIKQQKLPKEYVFYPFAVSNYNGLAQFFPVSKNPDYVSHTEVTCTKANNQSFHDFEAQVNSLSSVMQMLKHNSIDLLKMDIEGSEYNVIQHILEQKICINQICLEFHHNLPFNKLCDTKVAIEKLRRLGFKLFYQNHFGDGTYSFIQSKYC